MFKPLFRLYYKIKQKFVLWWHSRKKPHAGLAALLKQQGKTAWLDMGSSVLADEGFMLADTYPETEADERIRHRYRQFNATLNHDTQSLKKLGKFDLIRMQHVFEHFSPEEAVQVLKNCHALLNDGGYLLLSVPDLKIFIKRYHRACLDEDWVFKYWAETRVKPGAPQSYYFSVFTHSVPKQAHHWCYDFEGLRYSLEHSGLFKDVKRLSLFGSLSNIPFTHNRPFEDLCVLAKKA